MGYAGMKESISNLPYIGCYIANQSVRIDVTLNNLDLYHPVSFGKYIFLSI